MRNGPGCMPRQRDAPGAPRETALYITGFRWREVYGLGLTLDPEATVTQLRTSWGGSMPHKETRDSR
jgi:hypothetical protein